MPPNIHGLVWSFSSVASHVQFFATPWPRARQVSLSITNSQSLLKLMSIMSVMPSNHLILCCPLLLSPSIFSSIRVFSKKSVIRIRWPKYWSPQLQHQSFQWIFSSMIFAVFPFLLFYIISLCFVAWSCLTLCHTMGCSPLGSSVHRNSPGKNTEVGYYALL